MTGPFLYDDRPEPLHTGEGRRRTGLLIAMLAGTVVVAVGMVGLMGVFKGSAQDQAKELRVMLRLVGRCSRFRSVSPPAVSNALGHLANR